VQRIFWAEGMFDDTAVSPAKTAEPIEMMVGLWTRVGQRKHYYVLDGGPDPPWKEEILKGKHVRICATRLPRELCEAADPLRCRLGC